MISNIQQKYQNKLSNKVIKETTPKKNGKVQTEVGMSKSVNRDYSPKSSKSIYKAVVGSSPKTKK